MESLKRIFGELEQYQNEYSWYDKSDIKGSISRLRVICEDPNIGVNSKSALILQRIDATRQRFDNGFRVINAFPKMRPAGLGAELDNLRQEWSAKRKDGGEKKRFRLRDFLKKTGRNAADSYQNLTFMHIVWVFLIGSVIGYIVETGWCLLNTGVVESRQGMLYGPFSQIYGFVAVIIVLLLTPLSSKSKGWVFFGSAAVGGLFEVVCSLIQEAFFGSVSWQYSEQPFAMFGGRTNLMYMCFWGALGTIYICFINPKIISFIDRLPKRPKRFFTWVIIIGLSLNMMVSALSVSRWSDRIQDKEPRNQFEEFLDNRYPNKMMEEIYPNMEFLH